MTKFVMLVVLGLFLLCVTGKYAKHLDSRVGLTIEENIGILALIVVIALVSTGVCKVLFGT